MPSEQAPGPAGIRAPDPAGPRRPKWQRLALRLLAFAAVAVTMARLLGAAMAADTRRPEPAGFVRGLLHGAAMPMAWPGLLTGTDAVIYAPTNTGRPYKLGYTLGVNFCGALFFGWTFWRWNRWKAQP